MDLVGDLSGWWEESGGLKNERVFLKQGSNDRYLVGEGRWCRRRLWGCNGSMIESRSGLSLNETFNLLGETSSGREGTPARNIIKAPSWMNFIVKAP